MHLTPDIINCLLAGALAGLIGGAKRKKNMIPVR